MARAYAELFSSAPLRLTTFANDEGYDELGASPGHPVPHRLRASPAAVLRPRARRLTCPAKRIVGLSKLARLVEHFAARPQVQERLTKQVAECLATRLRAPAWA